MFRSLRCGLFALLALGALLVAAPAVGTASATLTAGTLAITTASANFSYAGTLTGDALILASSFTVAVNDATGSKAGWNLQATIGVLTSAARTRSRRQTTRSSVWRRAG